MATVNKIEIAGLEGNTMAEPRVFAHAAKGITLPAATTPVTLNDFVYVVPNTNVTASAGDTVSTQTRGACIYVGGAGDIDVEMESGDRVTFKGVTAGSFLPILVIKVYSTDAAGVASTTATEIIALF